MIYVYLHEPRTDIEWVNPDQCLQRYEFSDGVSHDVFDITYYKMSYKGRRGLHRILNPIKDIPVRYANIKGTGTIKYFVTDIIFDKGYWGNPNFSCQEIPHVLLRNLDDVIKFYNKNLMKAHTPDNKIAMRDLFEIIRIWNDGMIFEAFSL